MLNKKTDICNPDSFATIYKTYAKDLKRFIFFKVQQLDIAEDLVQDAFIKLWDNCGKVDYNKVKSYLFSVVNNMFLNHYKHNKVVQNYKSLKKVSATNESPEFIFLENEFMDKLERTLANLPEKQREVFLLNRIENKKYKDISEQLGISVKAVEKRMHQALIIIRKEIGNI